jgi:hypothetical protein
MINSLLLQKDGNNADIDYNTHQSRDMVEHGDTFLSSQSDLIPDFSSNHFVSIASSQSVSIEAHEYSIADAKDKKLLHLQKLSTLTLLTHFSWAH